MSKTVVFGEFCISGRSGTNASAGLADSSVIFISNSTGLCSGPTAALIASRFSPAPIMMNSPHLLHATIPKSVPPATDEPHFGQVTVWVIAWRPHGTFYIFFRSHKDRDRCDPPCFLHASPALFLQTRRLHG